MAGIFALIICGGCSHPGTNENIYESDTSKTPSAIAAETELSSGPDMEPSKKPSSEAEDTTSPGSEATGAASLDSEAKGTASSNSDAEDANASLPETHASQTKDSSVSDFKAFHTMQISQVSDSEVESCLQSLTLEEKVAQLFIILPESLVEGVEHVTAAGDMTRKAFDAIPVGGFIYLNDNLQSAEQVKTMLSNIQTFSKSRLNLPAFLCIDEEGGPVARIGGKGKFDVPIIGNMSEIGKTGDPNAAYEVGVQIGSYLSELGFNLDFAPVADVLSNPDNTVVKKRSFGENPANVSAMALAVANGLHSQGILSVYKHFPGHGATAGDTHDGYAYTEKTIADLKTNDLLPFRDGIQAGIPIIMVGHFSLPRVTGNDVPASLSPSVITDLLRKELAFEGIIITDALDMGAIAQQYSSAEAAVQALLAGNDLVLMPKDFHAAYQGVLDAIARGELTEARIDESVRRILRVKMGM